MPMVHIDESLCKGCGLCVHVCPKKVLELSRDKINAKGYNTAVFLSEKDCIGCAFCGIICPDFAIKVEK